MLPRSACAAQSAKVNDIRVISKQPAVYCGWPTLTRRGNGELLLVWSGGREAHVCPFGRVDLTRSHDNGQSWTWPETVLDGPIDDRDAGAQVCKGDVMAAGLHRESVEGPDFHARDAFLE